MSAFIDLTKIELSKAVRSPWFFIALLVGLALAVASATGSIDRYWSRIGLNHIDEKYYAPFLDNAYRMWMSVDHRTPSSTLFYKLAPLLAALPCGWSIASERKSGYFSQICVAIPKGKYICAKCIAAFVVGGLVVAIPQLVNFLAVCCFVPMVTPVVTDAMYSGIFFDNLFSYLFYNNPNIYVVAYVLLDFVLCGLWSAFVLVLGCAVKSPIVLLTGSYLSLVLLQFLNERIFLAMGGVKGIQMSLFENLQAHTNMYVQSWDVIIVEGLILVSAMALLAFRLSKSDEL